ncbi:hypothetical protein QMZ30_16490 [Pantoea sp. EA-12]|uniref:hypothetical protein n=1 Tax=Pantoea sp. EA-12 TaxID=3043303 RepID=UPI0024B55972|nr:hypothetical protein [Pantoea sp. EA-12]MDI9222507.1 hypothetical protein [Pantoea sp. EA-12]
MAKGDQNDFYARILALLPTGWFADNSPLLNSVLVAAARTLAWCHTLYRYAQKQTRISTATEGWLDMAAYDFFGDALQRPVGMTDDAFRKQTLNHLFRECGTRQAIISVLIEMTGNTPVLFEPQRPEDTVSYGGPALGYGKAGGYGSLLIPYQAFVVAYRPRGSGLPCIAGYHTSPSGYGTPSRGEYVSLDMFRGEVTDAQIYAAVAEVKPEGTIVWVRLQ